MAASSHDIPLLVKSANAASERRVSPAWTIAQLKARLEPITGIPVSAQKLQLGSFAVEAVDEDATNLSGFGLQPYAELQVKTSIFISVFEHVFFSTFWIHSWLDSRLKVVMFASV
jgi:hypothetical protein